ncbi:PIN domain-containing protein [Anabaena azotica]|uniref:PIN domain-containing protein n=1 Tax=Anabaena azotica TaxID=197653 RepID=UPI0039A6C961
MLDASAFLAYLRDEPGAEIVENVLIDGCYISIINWVEVLSKVLFFDLKYLKYFLRFFLLNLLHLKPDISNIYTIC